MRVVDSERRVEIRERTSSVVEEEVVAASSTFPLTPACFTVVLVAFDRTTEVEVNPRRTAAPVAAAATRSGTLAAMPARNAAIVRCCMTLCIMLIDECSCRRRSQSLQRVPPGPHQMVGKHTQHDINQEIEKRESNERKGNHCVSGIEVALDGPKLLVHVRDQMGSKSKIRWVLISMIDSAHSSKRGFLMTVSVVYVRVC